MSEQYVIRLRVTRDEREQIKLAAKLCALSSDQYIRRAINALLRHQGVDAVLLREKGDDRP